MNSTPADHAPPGAAHEEPGSASCAGALPGNPATTSRPSRNLARAPIIPEDIGPRSSTTAIMRVGKSASRVHEVAEAQWKDCHRAKEAPDAPS